MRRPVANLLLLVFLAGLCAPVMQAQSRTPACCRRAGQHRCASGGATPTSDGFRSLASCCLYPHPQALTAHGNSALGGNTAPHLGLTVSRNVVALPDAAATHSQVLANLQRGPPLS